MSTITTAAELDALPVGSIVIDAFAAACVKARQTEPSMPSDWVRVTTAVKGGEHHHRPFVPGVLIRYGLDDPDQQPTVQPTVEQDSDMVALVGTFLNYVGGRPVGAEAEANREKVARRIIAAVGGGTRPTVERVTKALLVSVGADMSGYLTMPEVIAAMESAARAVLALIPGRTEAAVKAEALREAAAEWSDWDALTAPEEWLTARADRIEGATP